MICFCCFDQKKQWSKCKCWIAPKTLRIAVWLACLCSSENNEHVYSIATAAFCRPSFSFCETSAFGSLFSSNFEEFLGICSEITGFVWLLLNNKVACDRLRRFSSLFVSRIGLGLSMGFGSKLCLHLKK